MFQPSAVGARVKRLREALDLNERDFATLCENGLTTTAIRSLEGGRKADLTVNQLVALSFHLGVTPAELLFGTSDFHDEIDLVPAAQAIRANRATAIAWFSGLKSPANLAFRRGKARVTPPDQSTSSELIRVLERQRFLTAEIERHRKLEQYHPGPINSIMIRALESELAENNHFLSLVGVVPPSPKAEKPPTKRQQGVAKH